MPSTSLRIGKGVTAAGLPKARDGRSRARILWGRTRNVLSVLLTIVLVAGAIWTAWQWWQRYHDQVTVTAVGAAPAQVLDGKCDVRYDIVGTISTDGHPGTISYEWVRSDGQNSGTLKVSVASGQKTAAVHLYWTFSGKGSMDATATLRILDAANTSATAKFPYSCQ